MSRHFENWKKALSVYYRLRDRLLPEKTLRSGLASGAAILRRPRNIWEGIRLLRDMKLVAASRLFDSEWYLQQNPDVAKAGVDPLRHYLRRGAKEGRDPNPYFDSDWYLQQNPDVARTGVNPFAHYLRWGAKEGRRPNSYRDKGFVRNAQNSGKGRTKSLPSVVRTARLLTSSKDKGRPHIGIGLVEHLGDIVACEPVVRHVRNQTPEAKISWVVREPYRELLDSNPYIHKTIVVECLTDWIKLVAHGAFDRVIDLHVNKRMCKRCGIPLSKTHGDPSVTGENYFNHGSLLASFCLGAGLPPLEEPPRVYISREIVRKVDALGLPDRFVVFHCYSNEAFKDWNMGKWNALAEHLAKTLRTPVVEVGLEPALNIPDCINLCGKTSLLEMAEVIKRAALFVGVDSGPAHLANAVDTYGVVIMGQIPWFKRYNPFTGGYADGSNAILIRNENGPAVDIPLDTVKQAIELKLRDQAEESVSTPTPRHRGTPLCPVSRQVADLAACTIIAKNYISAARVLAKSFQEHNPNCPFFTLLVDTVDGYFDPRNENFFVLDADNLPIPNAGDLFFKYSLLEASTAVKPYFLEHLFRQHELKKLIYLDPDILVTGSFSELSRLLDANSIVLTPHLTAPYDDNLHPGELQILQDGTFNLGFIALRDSELTRRMLSWWEQKLRDHCYMAQDRSVFVDQKWMNLVPGLFGETYVLREPGYNVAYWNLHERRVKVKDDEIAVNGKPAYFFHFSGFDPDKSSIVSKHQNRFRMEDIGDARILYERYCELLYGAGRRETANWRYSRDYFENGVPIPAACRDLYRTSEEARARFDNPFGAEFFNWLNEDVNGEQNPRRKITRLWYYIYMSQPGLQLAYPDVLGGDRELFAEWTARSGRFDHSVDTRLVPYALQESGQTSANSSLELDSCIPNGSFGINVAGYVNSEKGVGEGVRSDLRALQAAGIPHVANCIEDRGAVNLVRTVRVSPNNPYGINLIHVNADRVADFAKNRKGYFQGKYNIGYWAWELSSFPQEWSKSFSFLDEVWVPSTFTQEAVISKATIPVRVIPHCIDPDPSIAPDWTKERFGLAQNCYVFLYLFDFHSIMERKNPLGVIRAFREAFGDRQDVVLCIKCAHSRSALPALNKLEHASHGANIKLLDSVLPRETVNALMYVSDCYVSLHRSEGFGLTMSEAMSLGKPVIATGYSGNMDFMTESNSFPVRYKLVKIERDYGPYKKGCSWADPDLDHAAELMRYVFEHREQAAAVAQKGRSDVLERLHPKSVGSMIHRHLIDTLPSEYLPPEAAVVSRQADNPLLSSISLNAELQSLEVDAPANHQDGQHGSELPIPPLEMRELVGRTDVAGFDNPTGSLVYPYLPSEVYKEVFDFGCGCGRVARQLLQQRPSPARYLGIDLHQGMIRWCKRNLQPIAPNFEFLHHDVFNSRFNPGPDKSQTASFPAGDREFTLVNALSVFTHLLPEQAEYYLRESARILRPDGVLHSSWFLFDREDFPFLQDSDHALYVSHADPSAAVLLDRDWVRGLAAAVGLTIFRVVPPAIRGHQWLLLMTQRQKGLVEADFPPDSATKGLARPPIGPPNPHQVGLECEGGGRPAADGICSQMERVQEETIGGMT